MNLRTASMTKSGLDVYRIPTAESMTSAMPCGILTIRLTRFLPSSFVMIPINPTRFSD